MKHVRCVSESKEDFVSTFDYVLGCIEKEGMDYCFKHYDSFTSVKDPKFHELRVAYLKASRDLEMYCQMKGEEEAKCKKCAHCGK